MPIFIAVGFFGNFLNLLTLRSRALQSVPFMYIRAIGVFDQISLFLMTVFCIEIIQEPPFSFSFAFYLAHINLPIVNTFLTVSLFIALLLTVERYRATSSTYLQHRRLTHYREKFKAKCFITVTFVVTLALHLVALVGRYTVICVGNDYNCIIEDSHYYSDSTKYHLDWFKEIVCRMVPVTALAALNIILVKKLQNINKRRKLLKSKPNMNDLHNYKPVSNNKVDKRLTTMMIGITVIYVAGNIPQSVLMTLLKKRLEMSENLDFQIFRSVANVMEIGNHCLNFYIFCLTSQDYLKSFVRQCKRLKKTVVSLITGRRPRGDSIDSQITICTPPNEPSVFSIEKDDCQL